MPELRPASRRVTTLRPAPKRGGTEVQALADALSMVIAGRCERLEIDMMTTGMRTEAAVTA